MFEKTSETKSDPATAHPVELADEQLGDVSGGLLLPAFQRAVEAPRKVRTAK